MSKNHEIVSEENGYGWCDNCDSYHNLEDPRSTWSSSDNEDRDEE